MSEHDRLMDLLVRWEEGRRQGAPPTPEELCPDDPALREELRRRIDRRRRPGPVFQLPTEGAETAAPAAAPTPEVKGYEVLGVLGRGGMGVVYRARREGLDRDVALKMVLAGAAAAPADLDRFRSEALAVARLQHPNIVQVYDVGEQDGQPFLALEYVSGGSLADRLDGTPLPPRQAAEILLPLARAVHHAHERGIIHRDLKPANVLLASGAASAPRVTQTRGADAAPLAESVPKITDFGLVKRLDDDAGRTRTGTVLGSPSYMAPEQAAGDVKAVGPAADVYALGAILYEMLAGRPPFRGDSVLETLRQVLEHDPVPPGRFQPKVPRDLETICLKCLEKVPGHRYPSAEALARDLAAFLDGEPVGARPATVLDHVARAVSRAGIDVRFRAWGRFALLLAPVPALAQAAVALTFLGHPSYPAVAVGVTGVLLVAIQVQLLGANRAMLGTVPGSQRRHVVAVLRGFGVGTFLIFAVVWWTTPADRPERLLLTFPLWMILGGQTLLALATEVGPLYLVAALGFGTAVVAALLPSWGPLLMGLLGTVNLATQGLFLRRLGGESRE